MDGKGISDDGDNDDNNSSSSRDNIQTVTSERQKIHDVLTELKIK